MGRVPPGVGPLPRIWCLGLSWSEMTGPGWWVAGGGCPPHCYRYSSSRACLRASRSAWQDILQKGMLCYGRKHPVRRVRTSCPASLEGPRAPAGPMCPASPSEAQPLCSLGAQQVAANILRGSLCLGAVDGLGWPRDWCRLVSGLERRMGVSALLVPDGEGVPRRVFLGQ